MKCLRCGRELGNKTECDCGHFYENNVGETANQRRIQKRIKKIKSTLLFVAFFIVTLCILIIIPVSIDLVRENKRETEQKYNEYCSMKCESDDFSIEGNYCVCEPNKKILIEEKEK